MPFLVQCGYQNPCLDDLVDGREVDGTVLAASYSVPPAARELTRAGGRVFVDPQTYKLAEPAVQTTVRFKGCPYAQWWKATGRPQGVQETREFVQEVLAWQQAMGATDLISPYFLVEDADGDNFELTLACAEESLDIVAQGGGGTGIWMGLLVAGKELKRPSGREAVLNRVTGSDIARCYLIVDVEQQSSGPVEDVELIQALREVVKELSRNGIDVVMGYADCLGLGLMADGLHGFASGVSNSLRKLRIVEQRAPRGGGRRAKPRYFVPGLMNFVRLMLGWRWHSAAAVFQGWRVGVGTASKTWLG